MVASMFKDLYKINSNPDPRPHQLRCDPDPGGKKLGIL